MPNIQQYNTCYSPSQVFYATLADYNALTAQGLPVRPGCVVIDMSTTPVTILGISDGAGNLTGVLSTAQAAAVAPVTLDTSGTTAQQAASNSAKIVAALAAISLVTVTGGMVRLSGVGIAPITGTHTVYSGTTVWIDSSLTLANYTNLTGSNVPLFVNANWQSSGGGITATNGITDAATTPALTGMRLATVDCGANAHGMQPGQWVLVKNDTTKKYIGIWKIQACPTAFQLQFYAPSQSAIGSSAGTVTVQQADADITFTGGGTIDYRGIQNQADYSYNAMTMIFNKVKNLKIDGIKLYNGTKYGVYWGNLVHARFLNVEVVSPSDGIQGIGFGLDIVHQNIMGSSGDDFIAYTSDNTGYTQYNFPNGDLGANSLIGFVCRDIFVDLTTQHAVAVYNVGTAEMSGILIDGIECLQGPAAYVYIDAPPSGLSPTGFADITIKNLRGLPATTAGVKIGGQATAMTIRSISIDKIDFGSGNMNVPLVLGASNVTLGKFRLNADYYANFDSTSVKQYGIQFANGWTCNDIIITGLTINNAVGANNSYILAGSYAAKDITIENCKLFGTSYSTAGAPTGTPVIRLVNNYADSNYLFAINGACDVILKGNKFGTAVRCILFYGSGYTAYLRAYGNDWGTATYWLSLGATAGDTLQVQLWNSANGAASGIGSGIEWVSTSGSFYLRQCDGSLGFDAAKWTAINSGCLFYNLNAAYGAGVGLYGYGAAGSTRIAA